MVGIWMWSRFGHVIWPLPGCLQPLASGRRHLRTEQRRQRKRHLLSISKTIVTTDLSQGNTQSKSLPRILECKQIWEVLTLLLVPRAARSVKRIKRIALVTASLIPTQFYKDWKLHHQWTFAQRIRWILLHWCTRFFDDIEALITLKDP